MSVMAKKKPTNAKKPVYPSRENVKYTSLPKHLWDILNAMAEKEERSVAYFVRKYVTDGLKRDGKLDKPSE